MSLQCEKTGCEVYLQEYSLWVRGDSFRTESGDLVVRVTPYSRSHSEVPDRVHYRIVSIAHWFDQDLPDATSTLFANSRHVVFYGDGGRDPGKMRS